VNKGIKYDTAVNLLKLAKNKSVYLLEIEATVRSGKTNVTQIIGRETRITYSWDLEKEIFKWICYNRQNKVSLTAKDIRKFALKLIVPHTILF